MNIFFKILGLTVIDFGLIWLTVYKINPDPSVTIGIIIFVPLAFIVNIIIAGILFIFKRKEYGKLFLINSIISSILMYYLFLKGILKSFELKTGNLVNIATSMPRMSFPSIKMG